MSEIEGKPQPDTNERNRIHLGAISVTIERFYKQAGIDVTPDSVKKILEHTAQNPELDGFYSLIHALSTKSSKVQSTNNSQVVQSIFSTLAISKDKPTESKPCFYPLKPLSIKRADGFPQQENTPLPTTQNYKPHWDSFEAELKALQEKFDPKTELFIENLLVLLQKYGWCVPAGLEGLPEIPISDLARTYGAFAVCAYQYCKKNNLDLAKFNATDLPLDTKPFLLAGGDLSGIQSYLYDIIGTYAAKNLKGRSFYLQLITDTVILRLRQDLNLPSNCVAYASGGKFYMLCPNTREAKYKIECLKKTLAIKLFELHGTGLFMALGCTVLSLNDLIGSGNQDSYWKRLSEEFSKKKRRKFSSLITSDNFFAAFFEPSETGGQTARDAITGEEITKVRKKLDENLPVNQATYEQIELGKELKNTKRIAFPSKEKNNGNEALIKKVQFAEALGINLNLFHKSDFPTLSGLSQQFNELPDFTASTISASSINGFTYCGGNKYPVVSEDEYQKVKDSRLVAEADLFAYHKDSPKPFDLLAGDFDAKFRRLGVLRMDVDGLGNIFQKGFEGKQGAFVRYTTLSRSLDWFFRGYLNEIWNNNPSLKANTLILYSGGDDLFILGRWDCVIAFAEEIQQAFKSYTCNNSLIGISGGIVLVPPKFPIAKAAELCEDAEKTAKKYDYNHRTKNALALFKVALHWEVEFPVVKKLKEELVKRISPKDGLPSSLLQRIMRYDELAIVNPDGKTYKSYNWMWLMAYDFARFKERIHKPDDQQFLTDLQTQALCNKIKNDKNEYIITPYPALKLMAVAARWAEFENRQNKKEKNNE